ncbi:serine/threonine-protein kinase [Actinomadura spongiicola]|nr:serine/threonine-protein kinase [Actinomadura spongiicola]
MASPAPLTSADPTRLGGWELLGRLGTGGQGVVYLGRPARPGKGPDRVAVKLLHAQLVGNAGARERFVRELALLQRVAGFCTAQMLDADTAGDRPYIVSEYVPGRSLRHLVRDEGPRAGADLDRLAISSVTALSAIHRAGVVHRDLKPQNVLMGPDGPRVIDFGIARAFDTGATLISQVVGTPAYMAPEQFSGRVGPSTDLFAWAGTLLFAATGRDPFAGGSLPAVMNRIMHETPDLSVLPSPLADVAAACLAKDPKARPASEDVLLWLLGEREKHARLETTPANTAPAPHNRRPTTEPPEDATPTTIHFPPGTARPDSASQDATFPTSAHPDAVSPGAATPASAWPGAASPGVSSGMASPGSVSPASAHPGAVSPGAASPASAWPGAASSGAAGSGAVSPGVSSGMAFSGEVAPGVALSDSGTPGAVPFIRGPEARTVPAFPGAASRPRPLRRGAALGVGLVLAGLLAALDVAALAVLIALPSLSEGDGGALLPVVAASFAVVAVVTLVAVILAWRGGRTAAWTVMAARVTRVAMWGAWGALVRIEAFALAGHAVLTGVVVILLARGLSRSPR